MQIETGDLLFFRGQSLWSRIIRWRSRSEYSHVGIALRTGHPLPELCVIEAIEGHGVRLVPFQVWLDWGCEIDVFSVKHVHRQQTLGEAVKHLGCQYASPIQFVRSWGLLARRLARWLGRPADTDRQRFFCSELVATALQAGGATLPMSPAAMTPGDVSTLEILQHKGRLFS